MTIKELTAKQREEIFFQYMVKHFHKSEIKPFEIIEKLISEGKYVCYGLFNSKEDQLKGYAYFIKNEDDKILLLDYLAVLKPYRCHGIGGKFLNQMRKMFAGEYKTILAEVENPDFAYNKADSLLRKRRIQFYLKNGMSLSNVLARVSVDNYRILFMSLEEVTQEDNKILKAMDTIYQIAFPKEFYEKHIELEITNVII
ncbi:GNAT family N-acetyltransferase [Herbinix luporum]|jgi:GNAT superfamily N-acetyltransferase|uniref:N-acetyltransferase domain-containing protein n=1 Tax=Herbinix luporum TaxID=1679721 RepID=A0A0K8J544_9FIRM|nr:GNAT family N-acetyltransferase [Herbinix luporum]MDI9488380.1 GNAT family N-acetyltransferase [Bacillota bacterium]CUH92469.1 hypothetical protein SD1D_0922 [Herbinix luporum]HHT57070.1 GNAT family N-acetyltransferase [Herbinix luporum]